MSAEADRARLEYQDALTAARQAARAVEAMEAFAQVATLTMWRHSPKAAAAQVQFELEWAAADEEKRRSEEAVKNTEG